MESPAYFSIPGPASVVFPSSAMTYGNACDHSVTTGRCRIPAVAERSTAAPSPRNPYHAAFRWTDRTKPLQPRFEFTLQFMLAPEGRGSLQVSTHQTIPRYTIPTGTLAIIH